MTMEKARNPDDKSANDTLQEDDDELFHARILAVISDYGDKGFPISAIARRWNQIWPDRPFPSPENYIIQVATFGENGDPITISKRVRLLKFLKWKCQSVVMFRKIDGVELAFESKANKHPACDPGTNEATREKQFEACSLEDQS